jgi:hypothetical protein
MEENYDKLLCLDLNGLLVAKIDKSQPRPPNSIKIGRYWIVFRPGYENFLSKMYSRYKVAFFTSTSQENGSKIINSLLNEEQDQNTAFTWYRDHTHFDPKPYNDPYAVVKKLDDIWTNPVVNEHRQWSEENTLLIDDEYKKARFNPEDNVLIVKTFNGDPNDTELKHLSSRIRHKFENMQYD